MEVCLASLTDLKAVMEVVDLAKAYFKEAGIDQWQQGYPNLDSMTKDIEDKHLYVLKDNNQVLGCAAIIFEADPFYEVIESGAWSSDEAYGVIHRVAIHPLKKGQGLARYFFDFAKLEAIKRKVHYLRIDTHEDNHSMQRCILKQGFQYRGIVYVDHHAKRLAYDYAIDFIDFLNYEKNQPYMIELMAKVSHAYQTSTCYPPYDRIFYFLECTHYEDVRVVVLGQDPYHEPGQAMGLAFSVSEGTRLPPSLVNIYKELQADLGIDNGSFGDLTAWAKQGVLLLNDVLTVEAGKAHSHKDFGWQQFTDHLMAFLNEREVPMVFILWGNYAKMKAKAIDASKHCIITSAHPSPLSSYRGFFGSKPFSKANAFLEKHHLTPIQWRIDHHA